MKKCVTRVNDMTSETNSWRNDRKIFHGVEHSRGHTADLAGITVLYYHSRINLRLIILVTDNKCWNGVILHVIASV
jgi:hypothetical protein